MKRNIIFSNKDIFTYCYHARFFYSCLKLPSSSLLEDHGEHLYENSVEQWESLNVAYVSIGFYLERVLKIQAV